MLYLWYVIWNNPHNMNTHEAPAIVLQFWLKIIIILYSKHDR